MRHPLHRYHHSISILNPPDARNTTLDSRLIRQWHNSLRLVTLGIHRSLVPRLRRLSLQVHLCALLLGLLLLRRILLHSDDEFFPRTAEADVFDADVDAFLEVAVADLLVKNDAYGAGCDVVDYAGLTVVDFVGLKHPVSESCCHHHAPVHGS